jgi:hypothetical protein
MNRIENLRDVRYGELLFVQHTPEGFRADVWNTMGFNDCPDELFGPLDAPTLAAQYGALLCFKNGPRYWAFDALEVNIPTDAVTREFEGLTMRRIASLDLGPDVPIPGPFQARAVSRDNVWEFAAGRPRYFLRDAEGMRYVLQAYALFVDPTLTMASLPGLGERLDLPTGWTFEAEASPSTTLRVETGDENIGWVMQDPLGNSYQMLNHAVEVPAAE